MANSFARNLLQSHHLASCTNLTRVSQRDYRQAKPHKDSSLADVVLYLQNRLVLICDVCKQMLYLLLNSAKLMFSRSWSCLLTWWIRCRALAFSLSLLAEESKLMFSIAFSVYEYPVMKSSALNKLWLTLVSQKVLESLVARLISDEIELFTKSTTNEYRPVFVWEGWRTVKLARAAYHCSCTAKTFIWTIVFSLPPKEIRVVASELIWWIKQMLKLRRDIFICARLLLVSLAAPSYLAWAFNQGTTATIHL